MKVILSCLAVLAAAGVASAATLKVPQQFATIQAAVDAAADGDTIVVSKGTYEENVVVATPNLHFVGKKAKIDATVGNSFGTGIQVNAAGVTIQGFSFRNGETQIDVEADGCSVTKCTFVSSSIYPIYGETPGTNARIIGNKILSAGDDGVFLDGSGAFIQKNSFRNCSDAGVEIYGSGATVDRNSFIQTGYPVYIGAANAVVTANKVQVFGSIGVYVDGDAFVVEGNSVRIGDGRGFELYGLGGTLSGNTVQGCSGNGVYLEVDDSTIEDMSIVTTGYLGGVAFRLESGANNQVTGITVKDCPDGFWVGGSSNTFTGCSAAGWGYNGFLVYSVDSNTFDDCSAKGFNGQGFNNGGTNTALTGGSYTGNRIDIANDVGGGATFAGPLTGVQFGTGGATTEPEVE